MARKQTTTLTAKKNAHLEESDTPAQALGEVDCPSPATQNCSTASQETIRKVAYELYEARHGENGSAQDDWLQAEARIAQMPF
jgi:hypothetical protein